MQATYVCIRTNHEVEFLLFAESMTKTQNQLVNSHKAETHLSAGEQLICITPLPFHLQALLVFGSGWTSLKLNLNILIEKSWMLILFKVPFLHENQNYDLFPQQIKHL